MQLRSLLFCNDPATVQTIAGVCKELGITLEHCPRPDGAVAQLSIGRFDVIFLDDRDPRSAALVLSRAKSFPSCKKSLGVMLVASQTSLGVAFGAGTHLVIYKPITLDRVRTGLRAIRALSGRRHPRAHRVRLRIPARLQGKQETEIPATLLDVSESGVALRVEEQLSAPRSLTLSFSLPGAAVAITACAEIVWRDAKGHLGLHFVSMPPDSSRALKQWLMARRNR
jgi:PilZ domain